MYAALARWFTALKAPIGVADIPLLFETGHQADFDVVVVAACKPEQQLARLMARGGLSEANARARIAALRTEIAHHDELYFRRATPEIPDAAYDALNHLFSNDSMLLRVVRDAGLGLVDRLPGLKQMFVAEAAGLTGEVPRLLEGAFP